MILRHSIDYFRDEVRCGFYIPTVIKQAWATALDVLSVIDDICEKNGLKYFADWGTMLGAVRHGGFAPWDDDLDICMMRDDYERFRKVADAELPSGFVIHDYDTKRDHRMFLARVVNNSHISFEESHLDRFNNFPYLVGVDIFLRDYLYEDPTEEKKRDDEVLKLIALADGILDGDVSPEGIEDGISLIRTKYRDLLEKAAHTEKVFRGMDKASAALILGGIKADALKKLDSKAREDLGITLYGIAEKQIAGAPKSGLIGQVFPFILKGGKGTPAEYFDETVRLPFEDRTIPVPARYNEILASKYGDYLTIRKVWTGHDYPFFEKQKASLEAVMKANGSDYRLPGFYFDKDMLEKPETIDVSQETSGETGNEIVLFFPMGPNEWNGLREAYDRERAKQNTDILVIPLPVLRKNFVGEINMTEEEIVSSVHLDGYPEELPLADWATIDLTAAHISRIYIQFPYDGYNPILAIPEDFYACNLRGYADELIYIPPFTTAEFKEDDYPDVYNLRHYIASPAAVYSDRIYAQSENIRHMYINELISFAGEDTRQIWEDKIMLREKVENEVFQSDSKQKKKLLYCIGLNELAEKKEILINAIRSRLEIIKANLDKISTNVILWPMDRSVWTDSNADLSGELFDILSDMKQNEIIEFSDTQETDISVYVKAFDAYYGSASPFVPEFTIAKKPVMIADYEVETDGI